MQVGQLIETENQLAGGNAELARAPLDRLVYLCSLAGPLLLVGGLLLSGLSPAVWMQDYLIQFLFLTTVSLGGLCFIIFLHLTRAGWSVTVRRTAEFLAGNMFTLVGVLFLPIAVSLFIPAINLYRWALPEYFVEKSYLQHKAAYLNIPFFLARAALILLVWWLLGRFYLSRSVSQDRDGDPAWTLAMEKWSPLAALLFTVTITLASFDWIMSLTPAWYSTILPVYIFSGAVVGGLASLILLLIVARALGLVNSNQLTIEHFHDLGKLLFGFVIFWGYIAFSQYMLIWYGNIPEETQFYLPRQQGAWLYVSLALVFGHLLIPLVFLMPRAMKRNVGTLGFFAAWLLFFHWLDLYWLVKPNWASDLSIREFFGGVLGGLGAWTIVTAMVLRGFTRYAAIPVKDPRLGEALHHEVL